MATAAILCGVLVASSGSSRAGIVLNSGSIGISNYQLDTTTASSGSGPTFVNGILFSPGGGFPMLARTDDDPPATSSSQSPISSNFISTATGQPAAFGTGTTDILATLLGGNGASSAQGGIFWLSDTTLSDRLSSSPLYATNHASVSISTAVASFTNDSLTTPVNIRNPGALLSVTGTLGAANSSYVAAGLTSAFSLSFGGTTVAAVNLGSIALAASRGGSSVSFNGGGGGGTSASFSGGFLSASASSTNPTGSITLLPGETITFQATLTLISDPESTITINQGLAPGFPNDPNLIPDFGIMAGGPALAAVVPEPSTVVLMVLGLASAGFWARPGRRRGPDAI